MVAELTPDSDEELPQQPQPAPSQDYGKFDGAVRFEIKLAPSTDHTYPEVHYLDLLRDRYADKPIEEVPDSRKAEFQAMKDYLKHRESKYAVRYKNTKRRDRLEDLAGRYGSYTVPTDDKDEIDQDDIDAIDDGDDYDHYIPATMESNVVGFCINDSSLRTITYYNLPDPPPDAPPETATPEPARHTKPAPPPSAQPPPPAVKKKAPWTKHEVKELRKRVRKHPSSGWIEILARGSFHPHRTAADLEAKWAEIQPAPAPLSSKEKAPNEKEAACREDESLPKSTAENTDVPAPTRAVVSQEVRSIVSVSSASFAKQNEDTHLERTTEGHKRSIHLVDSGDSQDDEVTEVDGPRRQAVDDDDEDIPLQALKTIPAPPTPPEYPSTPKRKKMGDSSNENTPLASIARRARNVRKVPDAHPELIKGANEFIKSVDGCDSKTQFRNKSKRLLPKFVNLLDSSPRKVRQEMLEAVKEQLGGFEDVIAVLVQDFRQEKHTAITAASKRLDSAIKEECDKQQKNYDLRKAKEEKKKKLQHLSSIAADGSSNAISEIFETVVASAASSSSGNQSVSASNSQSGSSVAGSDRPKQAPKPVEKKFIFNAEFKAHLDRLLELYKHQYTPIREKTLKEFMCDYIEKQVFPKWEPGWLTLSRLQNACKHMWTEPQQVKKKIPVPDDKEARARAEAKKADDRAKLRQILGEPSGQPETQPVVLQPPSQQALPLKISPVLANDFHEDSNDGVSLADVRDAVANQKPASDQQPIDLSPRKPAIASPPEVMRDESNDCVPLSEIRASQTQSQRSAPDVVSMRKPESRQVASFSSYISKPRESLPMVPRPAVQQHAYARSEANAVSPHKNPAVDMRHIHAALSSHMLSHQSTQSACSHGIQNMLEQIRSRQGETPEIQQIDPPVTVDHTRPGTHFLHQLDAQHGGYGNPQSFPHSHFSPTKANTRNRNGVSFLVQPSDAHTVVSIDSDSD